MARVPVIILSGFLGSGKTTLLLNLLKEARKRKLQYSVLMNEFGSYDIDGAIVSNQADKQKVETLLDGCICCTKKSEVSLSIEKLLQQKPDVIFVELTGIANPEEVMDALYERTLIAKVYVDTIVAILDAKMLSNSESISQDKELEKTFKSQITFADMLIVNKIDLVGTLEKAKMTHALKENNATAIIDFTEYGRIQYDILFSNLYNRAKNSEENHQDEDENHRFSNQKNESHYHLPYSHVATLALPVLEPIGREKVEAFINRYENIIRAKGFIPASTPNETYMMQNVRKQTNWDLIGRVDDHYIVIIGIDLNERQIKEEWLRLWGNYQEYIERVIR